MVSYQGTALPTPHSAPHPRMPEGAKLGKGTSSTRANKAAVRPRLQALRCAFGAKTIGSVPSVPAFVVPHSSERIIVRTSSAAAEAVPACPIRTPTTLGIAIRPLAAPSNVLCHATDCA